MRSTGIAPALSWRRSSLATTDGDRQAFTVAVRNTRNVNVYTAARSCAGLWMGDELIPEPEDD